MIAIALAFGACSGGDDSFRRPDDAAASAPIAQVDAGSGGVRPAGPIDGLVVVHPSFGFGVYVVDPDTGTAAAMPGIAAAQSIDRNRDLVPSGDALYTLGAALRPGQSFAGDISIVRIDRQTGRATRLAPLGFDREDDLSEDATVFAIEAVSPAAVVVSQTRSTSSATRYRVFDPESGEETAGFDTAQYSFESDGTSCTGEVTNLVGLSDGSVMGTALGSPALVDPETGEVELLIDCDESSATLAEFISSDTIDRFAVFNATAPNAEQLERLLGDEVTAASRVVEGDGDLWWIVADTKTIDDVQGIVGGLVRFDLDDRKVVDLFPLDEYLGGYLDCADPAGDCELWTLAGAPMRYLDGTIVIVDPRRNGPVLTVDTSTGAVSVTTIVAGEGVDWTEAELLAGDPVAIWLEVRRMTQSDGEGEAGGQSASGPTYIERLDRAGGVIDLSLPAAELFF